MFSIIICSISLKRLETLQVNIVKTIGTSCEFIAIDNSQKRWPIAKVYNYGAKRAKYPYLFFVHEDVKFHSSQWGGRIIEKAVKLPMLNIRVLGTKFNAKAYLDEPSWITLKEGSVEVSTLDDRSKERMSPNDQVYYTVSDGLVLIRSSAQANVDSWTTGDLRFDNKTLKEMAKVIERRYDVKIRIMDSSLVEEYFTCHFRKDLTIAQAMELLKETRRVDYRIEKKTVYLYKK